MLRATQALALALPAAFAVPQATEHHAGHQTHHAHEHSAAAATIEGWENVLATAGKPVDAVVSFPISAVKLAPGSLYGIAQKRNLEFQLSLNSTQWLCQMTSAANLTACVGKCATPGGAGAPACEALPGEMGPGGYYGHYQGHYLSGTAMMYNNTGDKAIKAKADAIVAEMAKVQEAWAGKTDFYGVPSDGYIFPIYPDVFGIMEGRCGMAGPKLDYSVPYYTLHKLMAGLLDQHQLAGNAQALEMVTKMADWVALRVDATLKRGGQTLWQCVLNTEWGGMNEVMYNLYEVTGTEKYLETGKHFNHWQWTAPLAIGDDDIDASHGNHNGNHANTHIPEIIGSQRGYELTGNETQKAIAVNFFHIVTANHSWATGGSNDGEHWGTPQRMGDALNADTEESCTQYNILKVARHLFKWTASSSLGDFYERAIMNGIIGNQNKLDPTMTQFIYMLPLGAANMHKPWGKSDTGFPCCWGTLTEQFSKLSDSIYFASPDQTTIFVNQFMSSTITWAEKKVSITQDAGFPYSTTSTTAITVTATAPTTFTMKLRVPAWAAGANTVTVNGKAVAGVTAGEYLTIARDWKSGDKVDCHFPMSMTSSLVQDNRTAYNSTMAWMYGPLVLAGINASSTIFSPTGEQLKPETFIKRSSTTELKFVASGKDMTGKPITMPMIPLFEVMEESYAVYFDCQGPPYAIPWDASGHAMVPSDISNDYIFTGAAIGASKLPGASDIRTTGPNVASSATLAHPLVGKGHTIDSVSMTFRYLAGFDSGPGAWPVLSLELVDAKTQKIVKTVYTSPPLDKYKFDSGGSYSPPIHAARTGLAVDNDAPLYVRVSIKNNARNVQIPLSPGLGLNITVGWAVGEQRFTHSQWGMGLDDNEL